MSTASSTARRVDVHEIRVHGVSNSPPAEMLETTPDGIEVAAGEGTGFFWRRRAPAPAAAQAAVASDAADGIASVEAYSWGGQSRTGGTAFAVIGTALVRAGWFLLLPYALVNLAYWAREIPPQRPARRAWDGGRGAGVVRVFGLVLTLITVAAFTAVAVDMVALQCFPGGKVCQTLPGAFDILRGWHRAPRAALLGLVPIAAIVVLYLLGRRARVRFEPGLETFGRSIAGTDEEERPLLSTPGFWTSARIRDTSESLHLAASVFAVVLLLTFVPDDDVMGTIATPFWLGAAAGIAACVMILLWASSNPDRMAEGSMGTSAMSRYLGSRFEPPEIKALRKRRWALATLAASGLLYAGWFFVAVRFDPAIPSVSVGADLVAAPSVLIAAGLLLALWALTWSRRSEWRRRLSLVLLIGMAIIFIATQNGRLPEGEWPALTLLGVALLAVHLVLCFAPAGLPSGWAERSTAPANLAVHAWHGRGAAVAMLLALLVSASLNSLLVLGVSGWLSAQAPSGTTQIWRRPARSLAPTDWSLPDAYEKAAIILAAVVGATVVLLAIVGIVLFGYRRLRRFTVPQPSWIVAADGVEEGWEDLLSAVAVPGDGYPLHFDELSAVTAKGDEDRRNVHATARAAKRRASHVMHRGEALGTWVAGFTAIGLFVLSSPGLVEMTRLLLERVAPDSPGALRAVAVSTLAAAAVAAVAKVVADASSGGERPLGIFWDVVGFLPRAGHPFAPPCYAERAVPELAERVRRIAGEVGTNGEPVDTVLLSAHSMGSTICAATILSLRGDREERRRLITDRVALLSFGSQLRAYFSRFFPSVFGANVLGVPGTVGPSLWRADPWRAQVVSEFGTVAEPAAAPATTTLRGILSRDRVHPRWRNLWRRTDYLGFPVYGYPSESNPIDLGASEVAPGYMWKLADHSPYLGQQQYRVARRQLVHELTESALLPPPPPRTASPGP